MNRLSCPAFGRRRFAMLVALLIAVAGLLVSSIDAAAQSFNGAIVLRPSARTGLSPAGLALLAEAERASVPTDGRRAEIRGAREKILQLIAADELKVTELR